MFFSLIDHYNCDYYDEIIEKTDCEKEECVICLEKGTTVSLDYVDGYIKLCNCNVNIHVLCLEEWYKNNMKCIICKTDVVSVKTIDTQFSLEKRKKYIQTIKFVAFVSTVINFLLIYELYNCIVLRRMVFTY